MFQSILVPIDLADTDCLRLGTPGTPAASFSLTFWLKAGSASNCFADPIVRGARGDGATIIGSKVDTLAHAGWSLRTCSTPALPPPVPPSSVPSAPCDSTCWAS